MIKPTQMRKLYICGLNASGKGILRHLLDGHTQIINCTFIIGTTLLTDDFVKYIERDRDHVAREILSHPTTRNILINIDGKYKSISIGDLFVYLFKGGKCGQMVDISFSGKRVGPYVGELIHQDYEFDFIGFLNTFMNKILSIGKFGSIEQLQDTLYHCMICHCKSMKDHYYDESYFLQSAMTGYPIVENILKANRDKKIIALTRDPVALSYAVTRRMVEKFKPSWNMHSFISKYLVSNYESSLYSQEMVEKIKRYRDGVMKLNEKEEDLIVVNTEDIIINTKETMNRIADFLNIEKQDVLYKVTLDGKQLESKSSQLIGKIKDDPYEKLSNMQIQMLKYLYGEPINGKSIIGKSHLIMKVAILKLYQKCSLWKRGIMQVWNIIRN